MRIEHQRAAAPTPGDARDDVGARIAEVVVLGRDALPVEPLGDEARDLGFARPAGNERRVDRLDPDELAEQLLYLARVKQEAPRRGALAARRGS